MLSMFSSNIHVESGVMIAEKTSEEVRQAYSPMVWLYFKRVHPVSDLLNEEEKRAATRAAVEARRASAEDETDSSFVSLLLSMNPQTYSHVEMEFALLAPAPDGHTTETICTHQDLEVRLVYDKHRRAMDWEQPIALELTDDELVACVLSAQSTIGCKYNPSFMWNLVMNSTIPCCASLFLSKTATVYVGDRAATNAASTFWCSELVVACLRDTRWIDYAPPSNISTPDSLYASLRSTSAKQ